MRDRLQRFGYYGWWVVGASLVCAGLSALGQSYALALYMEPLADGLGLTRVEVAGIYAWATLAAALVLPLAGRLADRSRDGAFLAGVLGLMGVALLLLSLAQTWPLLAVTFFMLRLLGQGSIGLGVITNVLRWFRRRRGKAMAIALLGYAAGEFVMPSVIVGLQERMGWRGSLVALAGLYLAVFAPAIFFLVRGPREDELASPELSQAPPGSSVPPPETTARQALRLPRFWLLAVLASVMPFVLTAILFNHVALFDSLGWNTRDVARAMQAYALAGLAATYGVGTLLDRVAVKWGVVIALGFLVGALFIPFGLRESVLGVLIYGALLGASAGAASASNGVLWPAYFGVGSVGAIKGIVSTVRNGTTALGAPLGAWLIDRGGFAALLLGGAVVVVGSLLFAVRLPPPAQVE